MIAFDLYIFTVIGVVDEASREVVRGWAWNPSDPGRAVTVEVYVGGCRLLSALANSFRADVQRAGFGTGRYGFDIELPDLGPAMVSRRLHVRVEGVDGELSNSPVLLAASLAFDVEAERAFAALLASPGSVAQLRARLNFLTTQVDLMLDRMHDNGVRRRRVIAQGRKWRWRPEDGPEPAPPPLRALVIDEIMPARGRDAGSNAIVSHMQALQRIGYEVSFVAADLAATPFVDELNGHGITVYVSPWIGSVEEVLRRQSGQFDLVYLHRASVAVKYGKLVADTMHGARRIYSVADLHHLRLQRQAEAEGPTPASLRHAEHIRRQELMAAAEAHAVVTHSSHEAQLLKAALPRAHVVVAPWACEREPLPGGFAQRINLAFIGNFRHAPNRDAIVWLVDDIMPLVWRTDPAIACVVVGAEPPKYLHELNDSRIRVLGALSELDEVLAQVRLTVAPLLFGAGLKGKVVESLAAGIPCVCSPIAAEGFAFADPLRELVGEGAEAFAARILRVHGDAGTFERLRAAGIAYAQENFSRARVDERLREATGLPAQTLA